MVNSSHAMEEIREMPVEQYVSNCVDKRSDCEKSMKKDDNGKVTCNCEKRTLPEPFDENAWKEEYELLVNNFGEVSKVFEEFLREKFSSIAMNICKT